MVRNEAANIARCIGSIQRLGVVDEILILDTGSTDSTPQIANEAGAKVRILENPDDYFIETARGRFIDFSKARNESMVGASGDWLLLMDADEDVIGDAENLKNIIAGLGDDVEALTIQFVDIQQGREVMRFQSARLFKRDKVRFEGVVHNRPIFKLPAFSCPDVKIEIRHYGYDFATPEDELKKWNRTVGLLEYRLEQNPDDPIPYFYLAQSWSHRGEHQKSIDYAIKYIANRDKLDNFNPSIYFTLLMELKKANEPELMDKWLAEALKELPLDVDIAAAAVEYGEWQQKPIAIKRGSERFIMNYDALTNNQLANGTRFIYSYNDYQLTRALFHFGLMSIHEGLSVIKRLYGTLKKMEDKKYTGTVFDDLDREFRGMNVKDWRSVIGRDCKVVQLANNKKKKKRKNRR
jgi:glycosyltransferase involved in cell wall biosynthesis